MTLALPLGWTGTFDDQTGVLHLSGSDSTKAASVSFAPLIEDSGQSLLDRATNYFTTETHRLGRESWEQSGGRLPVGARAVLHSRASGAGHVLNGSAVGMLRRRRTGEIALDGRTWRVRHRSRWRAVVELEGQRVAVLTRRVGSRRTRTLDRTAAPGVQTAVVTEVDQLAVVLAATVMGPPGRPGVFAEWMGSLSFLDAFG